MKSLNLHKSFNSDGRFELNRDVFDELRTMKHSQISLTVPLSGVEKELNLKRNFISNGTTRIESNSGRVYSPNENIVHYGGKVEGSELSFVAISFTEHGIYGIIEDNFVVYGFDNLPDGSYSLSETPPDEEPWTCNHESAPEENLEPSFIPLQENLLTSTATSKCIYIRWDVDYSVIQIFGSTGATDTYIQALFNAHQQLFWNEGIQIYLNEVVYYDSAPSGFLATSDVLGNYGTYLNSINFQSTSSDCAQFLYYITPGGGGSGSAWRPGLCNFGSSNPSVGPYAQTRMNIFDSGGTPSSVVYSRTVKVITHELGHNLGCHHTFGCNWNISWTPGASTFGTERIDGSGGPTFNPNEGSCPVPPIPPGFLGTIMSYCDSTNLCGVSFALGFGPIPRQRMIDRINTTTCTTTCSEPLPTPAPTGLPTPTPTKTSTPTRTINFTPNPTLTQTRTSTPTRTLNSTPNQTPTNTVTPTLTKTRTQTPTVTPTITRTNTTTQTPTNTSALTPNPTQTQTLTVTPTKTQTSTTVYIVPKVDFVCVHWYKGPNSNQFINDMTDIINLYNKPIWITEFAPQTESSSQVEPNIYTQQEVNDFINTVVPWMNNNPMIERFAWHDSKVGTSAVFTIDGQLTETGITYRDAQ